MISTKWLFLVFSAFANALHVEHFEGADCTGVAGNGPDVTLGVGQTQRLGFENGRHYQSVRVHAKTPDKIIITAYSSNAGCKGPGQTNDGVLLSQMVNTLPNGGCVDAHLIGCDVWEYALGKLSA